MPGNLGSREYRMQEDQCLSNNPAICKCAEAAKAVNSAPAGAPLSANISYLYYLIKMGDGYINEIAAEITSFINQDKISCALGKQLAEDHVAHLTMLLDEARTHLSAGMERAGFAAPG